MHLLTAALTTAYVCLTSNAQSPHPNPFPYQISCDVFELAYEYAHQIQPNLTTSQEIALYDALQLQLCNQTKITPPSRPVDQAEDARHIYATPPGSIFVDATRGDDQNAGIKTLPLRTLRAAQLLARKGEQRDQTIVMRKGIYYLEKVLLLEAADSHLTIQNYQGELVEISGASPLTNLQWEKRDLSSSNNIWSTKISTKDLPTGTMSGLRYNGRRAIRARWPNGDPETQLFPDGWSNEVTWSPPTKTFPTATNIMVTTPNRSDEGPCSSVNGYCNYVTGVGGACEGYGFSPPSGYWCNSNPPRGKVYSTSFPSGMGLKEAAANNRSWLSFKPNEMVVNAFRSGHWFSYVFLVDQYDPVTRKMSWTTGGFQGGEGCGTAAEFNVENVLEELDSENEWFYDATSETLFWYYNGTDTGSTTTTITTTTTTTTMPPPSDLRLESTQLMELIRIQGAGTARDESGNGAHVVGIKLQGLKFTGTAMSYLEPHGLPSDGGGDWALARTAAVNLEGTEQVLIENCLFERLDGNGVLISGYNRNSTLRHNEFRWMGENGVVSWGYTSDFEGMKRKIPIPKGQGPDATDGNHPQGTILDSNFFHEIGHYQKQVSCSFQAQTTTSTHINNICFNGPRAGINFNDGMGGGHVLSSNLIFNMVRETADHGAFNSWDRQPFVWHDSDRNQSTYIPRWNVLERNFWINNYNSQEATDNDDGSCYYETHHNFFPFSVGGLKSDFGGHNNRHHDNVYLNGGASEWGGINCMSVCGQLKGHEDAFYNNTCILLNGTNYATFDENAFGTNVFPIMHDNQVFTTTGEATEVGSGHQQLKVNQWQEHGHDLGTTVGKVPSNQDIVEMARDALGMTPRAKSEKNVI